LDQPKWLAEPAWADSSQASRSLLPPTPAGNSVVSGQSWRSLNTVGGDLPIPSTILRGAELMSGIPDFNSKVRPFYLKSPESRVRQARSFIGRIYSFYLKPFRPFSMKRATRLFYPYSCVEAF
jgi:hypothetical protein